MDLTPMEQQTVQAMRRITGLNPEHSETVHDYASELLELLESESDKRPKLRLVVSNPGAQ